MRIFLIVEAVVLVTALLMAILRSLPGPVFFPVRALAVVYVDFFRGVPTILVILMLGQGIPALQLSWLPTDQIFWASVALVLVYTAYVSEVYRAGIESVHPSQEAAARSLGLTRGQALRHVVVPQAVRRVIPPLLNDFIGLQKDTALVSVLGIVEVLRQTQIDQAATFNGTYYLVAATLFVAITIPLARFTDWLVARDRRRQQRGGSHERLDLGVRLRSDTCSSSSRRPQVLRQARGPARDRPRARRARRRPPHRRLRLRQVDAPALRERPRADRRGTHRCRRHPDRGHHGPTAVALGPGEGRPYSTPTAYPRPWATSMSSSSRYILMMGCGLACLTALLLRFRRARGVERQQLRWLLFACAVTIAILLVVQPNTSNAWELGMLLAVPLIPLGAGGRWGRDPALSAV